MRKQGYHHGNLRQALVEAALRLITEKGPAGFTLAEAAKDAGVTPAAVYRHFQGREELITEAALQGHAIFREAMEAAFNSKSAPLAAFEATGRDMYLTCAGRILDFFVGQIAPDHDWRIPEHYTQDWQVDGAYSGKVLSD